MAAPARLHLGFLDLNGGLGRRFGSLGLAVGDIRTRIEVWRRAQLKAEGPGAQRALGFAQKLIDAWDLDGGVGIRIREAIPEHVGLGSGTQMALAVAVATARVHGVDASLTELADLMARGARSGIGIGTFAHGGFVVDGGRGEHTGTPPVISRLSFPTNWPILLVFDRQTQGLNGLKERMAFQQLPPMPAAVAADLCRRVLLQLLPALTERDYEPFSGALGFVQERLGEHFARMQGGHYTSPAVAAVVEWLKDLGIRGVGQTSWGPTAFAVLPDEGRAREIAALLEQRWRGTSALSWRVCRAVNAGAAVAVEEPAADQTARPARA